jgi:hypothetical protein
MVLGYEVFCDFGSLVEGNHADTLVVFLSNDPQEHLLVQKIVEVLSGCNSSRRPDILFQIRV